MHSDSDLCPIAVQLGQACEARLGHAAVTAAVSSVCDRSQAPYMPCLFDTFFPQIVEALGVPTSSIGAACGACLRR